MSEREDVEALLACLPMSDDGTGHIVDCGYDDEAMACGCYTLPGRLAAVLAVHDELVRADERKRLAREMAALFPCAPHNSEEPEWPEGCWHCDARQTIRAALPPERLAGEVAAE